MPKSFWYIVSSFIFLTFLLFKPVTVYILETYLSSLLKTEVEVVYLHLLDRQVKATIEEKDNVANIKINALYPLHADVYYNGNADAFNVYHPIKAQVSLKGHVYYKELLQIDAKLDTLGARAGIKVNENTAGWDVMVDLDGLDLAQLRDENNLSFELTGIVDGELDFHTEKDSSIKVSSNLFSLNNQVFKGFELQASRADDNLYAWALFNAEGFEYKGIWFHYDNNNSSFEGKADLVHKAYDKELIIDLTGDHNSSVLMAQVGIGLEDSKIDIRDLTYDMNSSEMHADIKISLQALDKHRYISELLDTYLQGDFLAEVKLGYKDKVLKADVDMQSLGGNSRFDYVNDRLQWQIQGLELSKVLSLLGKEEGYAAKINTQGSFQNDKVRARINTNSLKVAKYEIKNIDVDIKGQINNLESTFRLETPYASVQKAGINLKDLHRLSLEADVMTPYLSKDVSVKANVVGLKGKSTFEMNATSQEFSFIIPHAAYSNSQLNGKYNAVIEPELSTLKERLYFDGNFSYDEVFKVDVMNRDMGGELQAFVSGMDVELKGSKLSSEKLLAYLNKPVYVKGNFDIEAQGRLQDIGFTLKTKHLTLLKEETGVDENLSGHIKGRLSKDKLILLPDVNNRHLDTSKGQIAFQFADKMLNLDLPFILKREKESLNLLLHANITFQEDISGALSIRHEDDSLDLNRLIYKNKKLQTDINMDIKDLYPYKVISGEKLYGALKVSGKGKYEEGHPELVLTSDSFDGKLDIAFKDSKVVIDLKGLSAAKIGTLLHKEGRVRKGYLEGKTTYDLDKGSGFTKLDAKGLQFQGIDIDSELKGLEDVLGLNIFAMGSKLYGKRFGRDKAGDVTEVKHMKLDLDITPDLIISKDVAMSTESYRFALNANLKHNGDINELEIALLDRQGCTVLRQRLKGNIASPELVNSRGTALVILGNAPTSVLKTGGKVLGFGASIIDSSANFIWQKALRQDSNVTLINDTMTAGFNVFSVGKEMVVSGQCDIFYSGEVKHP